MFNTFRNKFRLLPQTAFINKTEPFSELNAVNRAFSELSAANRAFSELSAANRAFRELSAAKPGMHTHIGSQEKENK